MQRILSLATLGVLGGAVWLFLSGGGLNQLAVSTGQVAPTPSLSSMWEGRPLESSNSPTSSTLAEAQPAHVGRAAPPLTEGPTIRIASFNIEAFGKTKSGKPNVAYTLAEIVRQFHVVAIQEIRTSDDYHMANFVKLVNSNGRHYDYDVGPRLGNSSSTEQYAFVFDTDRVEMDHQSAYTLGDPDNLLHREPRVANFRARGPHVDEAFTFTLVNVHIDPDVVSVEVDALAEAYRIIRRAGRGEDDVIVLGDFNADDAHLGRIGQIPGVAALIRGEFSNTRQNRLYDNIIIHQPSTTEYAGRSGVFNFMRELGVQLTLDQAEQVSDHFPVWADFSVYERDYAGRIASRRSNAR